MSYCRLLYVLWICVTRFDILTHGFRLKKEEERERERERTVERVTVILQLVIILSFNKKTIECACVEIEDKITKQ